MKLVVIAKCIVCGKAREIQAGEVAPNNMPICECGNVMIATEAKRSAGRTDKAKRK